MISSAPTQVGLQILLQPYSNRLGEVAWYDPLFFRHVYILDTYMISDDTYGSS